MKVLIEFTQRDDGDTMSINCSEQKRSQDGTIDYDEYTACFKLLGEWINRYFFTDYDNVPN